MDWPQHRRYAGPGFSRIDPRTGSPFIPSLTAFSTAELRMDPRARRRASLRNRRRAAGVWGTADGSRTPTSITAPLNRSYRSAATERKEQPSSSSGRGTQ